MVLPVSNGISRVPPYSGTRREALAYVYGAVTHCGLPFHAGSTSLVLDNSLGYCRTPCLALQPRACNAGRLTHVRFGLFRVRSPLLAEYLLISFPEGTEMFHFPSFATRSLSVFSSGFYGLHP